MLFESRRADRICGNRKANLRLVSLREAHKLANAWVGDRSVHLRWAVSCSKCGLWATCTPAVGW